MALKKEIVINNPDNGVRGNYVKLVGVQRPGNSATGSAETGQLRFDVYLNQEVRKQNMAPLPGITVVPRMELWDNCPPPSAGWDKIAAYWYGVRIELPDLMDAVDVIDLPPVIETVADTMETV